MSEPKINPVGGDAPSCCPSNDNQKNLKKPGGLRSIFKKCAVCAGGGAGGLVAGHLGCFLAPAIVAATSAGLAAGLGVVFGIAATAGGMYAWHRLRGKNASKWEKRVVIGSAIVGLALSSAFNLLGGKHDHHKSSGMSPQENVDTVKTAAPPIQKCPNGCCGR